MNTQVSFLEGTYTLIHIPLDLYPTLLQPILRILLPQTQSLNFSRDSTEYELEGLTTDYQHGFLNISITPIDCSVVCHSSWAKNVFDPALNALPKSISKSVSVFKDTYMILSVTSAGLDPGGRVMELSSPLAFAGIPIFFITTYYSDFILVPTKEKQKVVQALLAKGFELSENQSNFVNPSMYAPNNNNNNNNNSSSSSSSSSDADAAAQKPPCTPPPSNDDELQSRTFDLLLKRNPRFLSLTLAQDDPPSLLLDKTLLPIFDDSLVGDTEGVLIPIFLDLVNLPFESTGIVCGVAGRLVKGTDTTESSELSYLSTARAGTVILSRVQSIRAMEILTPLLNKTP
ncbi:hypothetical protein M440DRAFT_1390245 [Trichoderma longibrachiatum ATCC 18648]|uniref:CASTOR ACT domain-containing protein n=1 Tax=Trichoderma longibrachiatum ATCC 18648 TaxID=983965 RepID=A0A2T4CAK7_TRILO|nr:hypothetical protein M440DRAFT_1390245 [Trichoderma longibrachiatum ATCC 18648]